MGVMFATASGNEEKMGKAKKAMIGAVIGAIVGVLAPQLVKIAIDMFIE